jgi:superoxide dismutase, Cu-Zn family
MSKKLFLIPGFIFAFAFVSCQSSNKTSGSEKKEEVVLQSKSNSKASGTLTVSELPDGGIHIVGKIAGLTPSSSHGFHVHEKGDCSDAEAMNAGGHFNPDKDHVHGASVVSEPYGHQHAGDLGNIKSNDLGIANIDVTVKSPKLTLESGNKYTIAGRAFVIHASPDDEKSAPAGNAGKRILCGVIE